MIDDAAWTAARAKLRAQSARSVHRRECPACEQRTLRPFRFPSGVWGFRCELCGEGAIVADWAARGHDVWMSRKTKDEIENKYVK